MMAFNPYQYQKNKFKTTEYGGVFPEKYADMIFRKAFEAPFISLEQDSKTDLSAAFSVVNIAAYLQEKVCNAWGKLADDDLAEGSEFIRLVYEEKEKLKIKTELVEREKNVMLSYFKLALILKRIQELKGKHEELEV